MLIRLRRRPHRDDEWNRSVRGEGPQQRADRNFIDLLQELRVMQTGVQILFALLLTIAFTTPFADADTFQRTVYVATLTCSAVATALLIAPVAYHRTLFQRGRKSELVVATHRLLRLGLIVLVGAVVGALLLVVDEAVGRVAGFAVSLAVGAVFVTLWFIFPARVRRRAGPQQERAGEQQARDGSEADAGSSTGTTDNQKFVGRAAGQDEGYDEETGAEARGTEENEHRPALTRRPDSLRQRR